MSRYSPRARLTNTTSTAAVANWFGNQFVTIPPGSFESIATVVVGSGGQTDIDFTSIPSTYKHLQIRAFCKSSTGAPALALRFNADTGNNYKSHFIEGNGASASSSVGSAVSYAYVGYPTPASANASMFGVAVVDILDYSDASKNKTIRSISGYDTNNTVDGYVDIFSSVWLNTNAVTSIKLIGGGVNFTQYSHFALYGIKGYE